MLYKKKEPLPVKNNKTANPSTELQKGVIFRGKKKQSNSTK